MSTDNITNIEDLDPTQPVFIEFPDGDYLEIDMELGKFYLRMVKLQSFHIGFSPYRTQNNAVATQVSFVFTPADLEINHYSNLIRGGSRELFKKLILRGAEEYGVNVLGVMNEANNGFRLVLDTKHVKQFKFGGVVYHKTLTPEGKEQYQTLDAPIWEVSQTVSIKPTLH